MTLTTDRMTEIMVAATVGNPPNVKGKEEESFLLSFSDDLAEAEEKGWIMEIPPEWEVDID